MHYIHVHLFLTMPTTLQSHRDQDKDSRGLGMVPDPFPSPIPVLTPSPWNTVMEGCFDAGKDMSLINERDQKVKGNLRLMRRGSCIYPMWPIRKASLDREDLDSRRAWSPWSPSVLAPSCSVFGVKSSVFAMRHVSGKCHHSPAPSRWFRGC